MSVRCRMTLTAIKELKYYPTSPTTKTFEFSCQYDTSIPEEARFQKATPTGSATFQVDNPAAAEQFVLGEAYYVDFTPAPKPTP